MTLTLDTARLQELRELVGAKSLSSALEAALTSYLARVKHLAAVDDWLAELEREHGPIPPETLEWAAQIVDRWGADHGSAHRATRRAG